MESFADPTTGTPTSRYDSDKWKAAVKVTDDGQAGGGSGLSSDLTAMTGDGTEMGEYLAYNILEPSIDYVSGAGGVVPGGTSDEDSTTLAAQGNTGLNQNISGTQMCTDYDTCSTTGGKLPIDQLWQTYSLTTPFAWDDGTVLTGGAVPSAPKCLKPISATDTTKPTYWLIKLPNPQPTGNYTGQNTIAGVVSDSADWY